MLVDSTASRPIIRPRLLHAACLMFDAAAATSSVLPARAARQFDTRLDPCGTDELKCTGRDTNSHKLIPFPENCTQYLRCTGSKLHLKSCPDGEFFDNVSLSCKTQEYQCQSACPGGIYAKYLYGDATTGAAVTVRPTPRRRTHDDSTAVTDTTRATRRTPPTSTTTAATSRTLSSTTTGAESSSTSLHASSPTRPVTSEVTSSSAHAQQTTLGGSATSQATTGSRDVTASPGSDLMAGMRSTLLAATTR